MKSLPVKRFLAALLLCTAALSFMTAESIYFPQRTRNIPSRVLSLAPEGTEILFAVGAGSQVIARTEFCDYPEEAAALPSLGTITTISLEDILKADPELVIMYAGIHDHLVEPLIAEGIGIFLSDIHTVEDILSDIAQIGAITGHSAEAEKLTAAMKKNMAAIQKTYAKKLFKKAPVKPTVYWEIWMDPYMTAGGASIINDLLKTAGFVNAFGDLPEDYPMISEESLFEHDPDVIIIPSDTGSSVESVMARPGWSELKAVKNGRVYVVDADLLLRNGPRIVEGIAQLNALAFPK